MDLLRKKRKPVRTAFTKLADKLEEELKSEQVNIERIKIYLRQLNDKNNKLGEVQEELMQLMINDVNTTEENYEQEYEAADVYNTRLIELNVRAEEFMQNKVCDNNVNCSKSSSVVEDYGDKSYRLPKLEIRKFDGNLRNWLSFWGQFKQIHLDNKLVPENKFQYLIQSIIPDSKAATLVNSYPPSAENYPKVIEQLQNRFGRPDLLVQVYVRELIAMVMENAAKGKVYQDLSTLYDKLESHLRALESLGRTKEKFTDFLCSLVESCLPKEVLRLWERSLSQHDEVIDSENSKSLLEKLMDFLRKEVYAEERINLAHKNFGFQEENKMKNKKGKDHLCSAGMETVASLVHSNRGEPAKVRKSNTACIFCARTHESSSCGEARKMEIVDRKKIVLDKGVCFICLKEGHSARFCRKPIRCLICGRKHTTIMCPDLVPSRSVLEEAEQKTTTKVAVSTDLSNHTRVQVLLGTFLTRLEHEEGETVIRCLIDTGSQKSYISENLANNLKLTALREETMVHGLFGGAQTQPQKHSVHRIYLCDMSKSFRCNFEVLTQPTICDTVDLLNSREIGTIFREHGIQIAEDPQDPKEIQLLIGADVAGKLLNGEVKSFGDLIAVGTKLGWMVMGKLVRKFLPESFTASTLTLWAGDRSVSKLWKLDLIGITDPFEVKPELVQQAELLQEFIGGITVQEDGRYQVCLPWKRSHPPLSDNREIAVQRLRITKKKLEKEGLLEDYQEVFSEWLEKEIIELVPPGVKPEYCHYLPHRPIIKEGSTTRIRPVFDASSHQKEMPSLNDCLEKGLNLIEEIPDVLERFRDNKIGIVSDIEKAFLQLEVNPKERDFLRFFGVDNKEYRHRRVVFGVASSPFLLNAVIKYHLSRMSKKHEETVQKLKNSFYVDNCVTSVPDIQGLEKFVSESIEIMNEGCFNLRGWESNYLEAPTPNHADHEVSVLGLTWSLGKDTLRSKVLEMSIANVTKRTILSCAQRIFDPLGYLCPATLYPKILLQELWLLNLGWDEEVPDEYCAKFKKWKSQAPLLNDIEVARYSGRNKSSQLHMFADASKKAYAAVVFLRSQDEHGRIILRLLRAKSRVAPIGEITIPRLELLACLIGSRLINSIKQALGDAEMPVFCWSDSTNALTWIIKEGSWTTFVQNRVEEIRKICCPDLWRYVPGELNPADLPSRGCTAIKLIQERWWEGPSWLIQMEESWPQNKEFYSSQVVPEVEHKCLLLGDLEVKELDYLTYFSSYSRIIRMVAWIRRFLYNTRNVADKRSGILSGQEIIEAEKNLFRIVQQKSVVGHRRASLAKIYLDDEGLLRIETRISEREDDRDFLFPIVLPGDHELVLRLIEEEHRKACHAGPQLLFGRLRERFWVIGIKKAIRKVIKNCHRCKRYLQKPIQTDPVVLPKDRVKDCAVFEVTGVDLAGPLHVKEGKVWIVLFTCAVYRAVHLEMVSSLTTMNFLQALRRFIARRGRPDIIYSDNGTNFCGAQNEFNRLNWNEITSSHDIMRINWKFNPPTAAWWGGWWERLVRIIKDLLKKTLHRAKVNFEELSTIMCECESIINSRPLTYCSGNSDELLPLTPALFLRENEHGGVEDIDKVEASHLQRRIRYRQELIRQLKHRFRQEYLGQLVKKDKKLADRALEVGEVVLVGDADQKRHKWPMGIVVGTHPGKDGQVRCAS